MGGAPVYASWGDTLMVVLPSLSPPTEDDWCPGQVTNTVRLWDVHTGAHLKVMMGHRSWIEQVAYSPDGLLIASCSRDSDVRIWDAAGLQVSMYTRHSAEVQCVTFSADGRRVASCDRDGHVHVWGTEPLTGP